jgi:adenylate kinase
MNILFFGPNGSGKGTQGAIVQKQYHIPHIESGVIFRDNISRGTELGKKAKGYIDRGELVPDDITIPMILDRLKEPDCAKGWLLDGFPRNVNQAKKLDEALNAAGLNLSYVIEIVLDRKLAKNRIMGRRLCVNDNNHPNNVFIEAIKPAEKGGRQLCRVCGGELKTRSDDQDEAAIDKRHAIYYNAQDGTLAAVNYFKDKAQKGTTGLKIIELDGRPGVKEVSEDLLKRLGIQK